MKVLKRTESNLVIGERGLDARHLGILFFLIGGGGFTALTIDGDDLSIGISIALIVMACLGLFAAVFMGKRLTHRLEKTTGTVRVEYPEAMNTRLNVEEFRISDVREIKRESPPVVQQLITSTSLSGGRILSQTGFSYVLKSGKIVEGGIFSSVTKEMEEIISVLCEFMDVPVE